MYNVCFVLFFSRSWDDRYGLLDLKQLINQSICNWTWYSSVWHLMWQVKKKNCIQDSRKLYDLKNEKFKSGIERTFSTVQHYKVLHWPNTHAHTHTHTHTHTSQGSIDSTFYRLSCDILSSPVAPSIICFWPSAAYFPDYTFFSSVDGLLFLYGPCF